MLVRNSWVAAVAPEISAMPEAPVLSFCKPDPDILQRVFIDTGFAKEIFDPFNRSSAKTCTQFLHFFHFILF